MTSCPSVALVSLAVAGEVLVIDWLSTRFILTNYRLLQLQAPLWRRSRSLPLSAVGSVDFRQDLPGRFLGYGTVVVSTHAVYGGSLTLDYVPDPEELSERIAAAVVDEPEE